MATPKAPACISYNYSLLKGLGVAGREVTRHELQRGPKEEIVDAPELKLCVPEIGDQHLVDALGLPAGRRFSKKAGISNGPYAAAALGNMRGINAGGRKWYRIVK